jgi:hypothetical protein
LPELDKWAKVPLHLLYLAVHVEAHNPKLYKFTMVIVAVELLWRWIPQILFSIYKYWTWKSLQPNIYYYDIDENFAENKSSFYKTSKSDLLKIITQ